MAGEIMHIDRFGNLIRNIHRSDLAGLRVTRVDVGGFPINTVANSYTAVPLGKPLALVGSSGYLEVAYNDGDRASDRLQMSEGILFQATVEPR